MICMQSAPKFSLIYVFFLILTLLLGIPASAQDNPVPAPRIDFSHRYNEYVEYTCPFIHNEIWDLAVSHGDCEIGMFADNVTELCHDNLTYVRYQQNIRYLIKGTRYLLQFTVATMKVNCSGETIELFLTNCSSFDAALGNITYVGDIPVFDFNLTFHEIAIETYGNGKSNLTFILRHIIYPDWNKTDIKIQAFFNLSNFRLILPSTHSEAAPGATFAIIIEYSMELLDATDPTAHHGVMPSHYNDTSISYDLPTDTGTNLTVSKLEMGSTFYEWNGSHFLERATNSSLENAGGSTFLARHIFPNLVYKTTILIYSDPQLTVFHDPYSLSQGLIPSFTFLLILTSIATTILLSRKSPRKWTQFFLPKNP